MSNFKAIINYEDYEPLELVEITNNVAEGIPTDPLFIGSPFTTVQLKGYATDVQTRHGANVDGTKGDQAAYVASLKICVAAMHRIGVWANFVCAGSNILLLKLKIPFYNASTSGRESSTFSLENGPGTGELKITVPTTNPDAAFIVMYSLEAEALLSDCKFAGGSSHCSFPLYDMPVGFKIYVRWAAIGAGGVGEWSEPYPIIVI